MRLYRIFFISLILLTMLSCSSADTTQTPVKTLKTYVQAIKKKDVAKMKALISQGSIKMATEEAKAQNIQLDEVILRETLFSADQKILKIKNEKIDGEIATVEVENSFGSFDRIPFVKEDGIWKIAKDKFADEFQKQVEEEQKKAFESETPQPTPESSNSNSNSNANLSRTPPLDNSDSNVNSNRILPLNNTTRLF